MTNTYSNNDLQKMLAGHRLVTAHIFYRMPDHQHLLQEFLWQNLDLLPRLPVLNRFLAFWEKSIDGPVHQVQIAYSGLVHPTDLKFFKGQNEFRLQ
jgi:uncharacterized protein Usg